MSKELFEFSDPVKAGRAVGAALCDKRMQLTGLHWPSAGDHCEQEDIHMKSANRFLIMAVAALALVMASVPIAHAITHGQPDGDRHPYVALVGGSGGTCSASAISENVLVTAAHCFRQAGESALVVFDSAPPFTVRTAKAWPHPDFCLGCAPGLPASDTHDLAVLVLDEPVSLLTYAALPAEGLVDTLPMMTDVTLVGYGIHGWIRGGGNPFTRPDWDVTRYYAPAKLIDSVHTHQGEYIRVTTNPAQGKGGSCFGDSGGPNLLGDTNIILATNSYVTNDNCAGISYSNRIDTPYALQFINSFLP